MVAFAFASASASASASSAPPGSGAAPWKAVAAAALLASSAALVSAADVLKDVDPATEPQCLSFLNVLNSDQTLDSCITPLSKATELYQNQTTSAASSSDLTTTLANLCGANGDVQECDAVAIRTQLTNFWGSCQNDIVKQTKGVYNTYDFLYVLTPFKAAICETDSKGNYCLLNVARAASAAGSPARRSHASSLGRRDGGEGDSEKQYRRQAASATGTGSDITEDANSQDNSTSNNNIAFLFVKPDSGYDIVCSECTRNILADYIRFEVSLPYAVGLSSSLFLQGQSALYKAATQQCGKSFAVDINQRANTSIFQEVGAAPRRAGLLPAIAVAGSAIIAASFVTLF
ncbi:hypothetical protein OC842_004606 [Tilletia horrida]|uniref:DUF7729 domain-containing protein n=1 Tax=Tilletia horrida TaxID=155126 RepID=A0AAN6JQ43_9BASI|nr:hypothetical protein OC842_004606 [Tilletia horrida]